MAKFFRLSKATVLDLVVSSALGIGIDVGMKIYENRRLSSEKLLKETNPNICYEEQVLGAKKHKKPIITEEEIAIDNFVSEKTDRFKKIGV